MTNRRALTLIEMLITFVVVGVILIGLGSLYTSAASDFALTSRLRERRFSREHLESELSWRFKSVPEDCLPTSGQLAASLISFPDEKGVQSREVLAYDFFANDTRINAFMPPDPTDPAPVNINGTVITGRIQARTGIVFQFQTQVFMLERAITLSTTSFRGAGSYQAIVDNAANRAAARLLAIGIDELDFAIDDAPRRVRWTIKQF